MPEPIAWTPAFPGQRPPLQPGHEVTIQHGARSPRRVDPLAADIERRARTSPSWPAYLDDPAYASSVTAWARSEAVVDLLWAYLAERDLVEALTDTAEQEVEETRGRGKPTRTMTTSRRTKAALDAWHKAESAAAGHRARLGLDPMSRAKLGKDVSAAAMQVGIAQMQTTGAELVAQARASGALTDTSAAAVEPASGHLDRQEPTS